jgi:hypothetical protein
MMPKFIESDFKIVIPRHNRSAVNYARKKMLNKFGGVTQSEATGYWKHAGKTVKDKNIILESADLKSKSPEALKNDRSFMKKLARILLKKTSELEIMTEEEALRGLEFVKVGKVL